MAMNRGVLESSPVQHLTAAGNPNWWNNVSGGLRSSPPLMSQQPPPPNFFSSPKSSSSSSPSLAPPISNPSFSSWLANSDLPLDQPWSLSQLLLGGLMMGEEEKMEMMYHIEHQHNQQHSYQKSKPENWEEEEVLRSMNQESDNNNGYVITPLPNSPPNKSCVTIHNNINEDDNNNIHNGLNLSECNSSEIIGGSSFANKKQKIQVPSSQSTDLIKVKKEKLKGRIASLHQIVSPFGKTDTASVLSEGIGYIRFLHSQIEALSLPYFGYPSTNNMMHRHASQGYRNGIFPEDPGQLMNEDVMIRSKGASLSTTDNQTSKANEEANKDLRSKGLCLVPISSTLQVGSNNGTDYWAPTFGFGFQ